MGMSKKMAKSLLGKEHHKQIDEEFAKMEEEIRLSGWKQNKRGKYNNLKGKRVDLPFSCDCSEEANLARILNYYIDKGFKIWGHWLIEKYWREPMEFEFQERHGVTRTKIDFGIKLCNANNRFEKKIAFIEVKGAWTSRDKTKVKRMKRDHPEEFKHIIWVCHSTAEWTTLAHKNGINLMTHWWDWGKLAPKMSQLIPNWEYEHNAHMMIEQPRHCPYCDAKIKHHNELTCRKRGCIKKFHKDYDLK